MNYISEINRFYNWLITNPISGNAQALWHRLMAYCNTFAWKNDFTITNLRLADELCISRQELDRVRNILCQKGLITYTKGKGNQCGTYHINSFASQEDADCVTQVDTQSIHKCGTNHDTSVTQVDTQVLPLNKLNKTKLNKTFKENNTKEKTPKFQKPTLGEVQAYCTERKNNVNANKFMDYYESKGWLVGKSAMKDWKASVRTWEGNNYENAALKDENKTSSYDLNDVEEMMMDNLPKW